LEAQNVALTHRNKELELVTGGSCVVPKEVEEQLRLKQEEVNESYRQRSESTKQIIELTQRVTELEKELQVSRTATTNAVQALEEEKHNSQYILQIQEEKDVTVNVLKEELLQLQVGFRKIRS
jgi:hypothetical protein